MWHTNENKWVCSVNPTANNGHFNRRTGENREGHYSGHLVLMWTKTWSTSITCLIICTMVINTTQKKLKIPWCHVSFPHTKGHVYDLSILIEICTVLHKLMHGTWERYICMKSSPFTLPVTQIQWRSLRKKYKIYWFTGREFFQGLCAVNRVYNSEYIKYVFESPEEAKQCS